MALWNPSDTDTALWLDASDSGTIVLDGSSLVEQWNDKSGNARHATQVTSSSRPIVGSSGGYPTINFTGSQKLLYVPRGFITSALSAFIVHSAGSVANLRMIDQRSTGAAGTIKGWYLKNHNASGDVGLFDDGSGNYRQIGSTTVSDNNISNLIFPIVGNASLFINGVSTGTITNGGATPTDVDNTGKNIAIGGNADGSSTQDFNGHIFEIMLFNRVVSATERMAIEGYLAHKWGLTSKLDSSHPYKTLAPAIIKGTITDKDGNPAERKVYAVSRPTDSTAPSVLGHSLSDALTGYYELFVPSVSEISRIVVSEDDSTPLLNDLIDRILVV